MKEYSWEPNPNSSTPYFDRFLSSSEKLARVRFLTNHKYAKTLKNLPHTQVVFHFESESWDPNVESPEGAKVDFTEAQVFMKELVDRHPEEEEFKN